MIRLITRAELDAAWADLESARAAGRPISASYYLMLGSMEQRFASQQRAAAAQARGDVRPEST